MKDPSDRTKVVLRHLPPAISEATLMEQIDGMFAGRYRWACFRPGKTSQKNHKHARAYIAFNKPEDVIDFAEFFDGHIFVNEKGAQFKALVEYSPSQRVPKACSKADGREGTILKDPEYLEFLEILAKPVENLPSAEIQLERKEAEKAGAPKDAPIVTPLMEFIRQKRAAKSGSQRSLGNGKVSRRAGGVSTSSSSPSSKRGSEKRRVSTAKYVLRDSTKNGNGKDKSTYILVSRREEQLLMDNSASVTTASGPEISEDTHVPGGNEGGKRRVLLLKGKEKDISHVSGGPPHQNNPTTSVRNYPSSALKQSPRNEVSGRIIRGILSNKDARQSQLNMSASQSDQQSQTVHLERDKRPPRPQNTRPILKDLITGSHKPVGRRGASHGTKELDYTNISEGKPSKRGPSGYGSHEKQVWVQKSGSGS